MDVQWQEQQSQQFLKTQISHADDGRLSKQLHTLRLLVPTQNQVTTSGADLPCLNAFPRWDPLLLVPIGAHYAVRSATNLVLAIRNHHWRKHTGNEGFVYARRRRGNGIYFVASVALSKSQIV